MLVQLITGEDIGVGYTRLSLSDGRSIVPAPIIHLPLPTPVFLVHMYSNFLLCLFNQEGADSGQLTYCKTHFHVDPVTRELLLARVETPNEEATSLRFIDVQYGRYIVGLSGTAIVQPQCGNGAINVSQVHHIELLRFHEEEDVWSSHYLQLPFYEEDVWALHRRTPSLTMPRVHIAVGQLPPSVAVDEFGGSILLKDVDGTLYVLRYV